MAASYLNIEQGSAAPPSERLPTWEEFQQIKAMKKMEEEAAAALARAEAFDPTKPRHPLKIGEL